MGVCERAGRDPPPPPGGARLGEGGWIATTDLDVEPARGSIGEQRTDIVRRRLLRRRSGAFVSATAIPAEDPAADRANEKVAADPDRDPWLLNGPRGQLRAVELVVLAREVHRLTSPQRVDDRQRFIQLLGQYARLAGQERITGIPDPHPENDPASRKVVQGNGFSSQLPRMAARYRRHRGTEGERRRRARHCGQADPRVVRRLCDLALVDEVVLQEDRVPAAVLRHPCELGQAAWIAAWPDGSEGY